MPIKKKCLSVRRNSGDGLALLALNPLRGASRERTKEGKSSIDMTEATSVGFASR